MQEGPTPSGITYRLSGDRFTTNALVNISCPGTVGTYRWRLADGRLVFTPLQDVCARFGEPSSLPSLGSFEAPAVPPKRSSVQEASPTLEPPMGGRSRDASDG